MKCIFYKNIFRLTVFIFFINITSCEEYLDMAPERDVTEQDVYSQFISFQGFVEEMYQLIPDWTRSIQNVANWNFSNDVYSPRMAQYVNVYWEQGNYWQWSSRHYSPFKGNRNNASRNAQTSNGKEYRPGIWEHGWYGIRLANLAIKNIEQMIGTEEERNLILGQAYFFRGFFHFAIIAAWGGVPYIDKAFEAEDKLDWPRLSYLECAERIAQDMEMAASLLPLDWDETEVGRKTEGANRGRITKGMALGYLGKNWLYAASPLMNGTETGDFSSYNKELARKSADAFNELLKLADRGYYGLWSWDEYYNNFWNMNNNPPIGKEWVFGHPIYQTSRYVFGEHLMQPLGGSASGYCAPTLELVKKFGMEDGLPLDMSPLYDPVDPWKKRDPRFYYSIITDGEQILHYNLTSEHLYAKFYQGGIHRQYALTGFGQKKFLGKGANNLDKQWNNRYFYIVPYMRLAHVYLMYAEAANEGYEGAHGASPGGITAEEAVNIVRNRANVPDLDAHFTVSQDKFREAVRNEIGVEMCLEAHQWYDYRRWYVGHLTENRTKTILEFDEGHTYFKEVLAVTIEFDKGKHYWLPFKKDEAALYEEFYQNPGW